MYYLTGTAVMIADGVMVSCAYTLVIARLWFRLIHQRVSLTVSDVFLLIAAFELLAIMCIFIKEHEMDAMHENFKMTPELKKLSFATVLLYDTSLYFLKFSILSFYHNIFPRGQSKLRAALYISIALTAIFSLVAPFLAIFWCGTDLSVNWVVDEPKCSFWNKNLFVIDWIMNMSSDIMILLLPFPLLTKLDLSRRQIVGLCVTFSLGLATILVSIFRFTTFIAHQFVPLYVWSIAEICTAIIVASLPALRPLLRRAGHAVNTRRRSSRILPIQRPPSSIEPPVSVRYSKQEHRSRNGEPPDGYHYTYDTDTNGSDVELHGGLRSDVNSKTETIAVYTDAAEVLDHHQQQNQPQGQGGGGHGRPNGQQLARQDSAKEWVQKTRQFS